MKKSLMMVAAAALLLCACAAPERAFENSPEQYGLYVASSNIFVEVPVTLRNAETNQTFEIKPKHEGRGEPTGYLVASLPAGRYFLVSYSPDGTALESLETPNGYFDVQANCFNYGGFFDFETVGVDQPTYQNTVRLKDIEQLPSRLRGLAAGRDICSAGMGKTNERIALSDLNGLINL
jgi:hypothetical protein